MVTYDLIIKNGKLVTPTEVFEGDLFVSEGKIQAISRSHGAGYASLVVDASGKLVMPGLIDSHVHFRDPGAPQKEDFETGSRGAAAGGVTTVFDMPTTIPVVTNRKIFEES